MEEEIVQRLKEQLKLEIPGLQSIHEGWVTISSLQQGDNQGWGESDNWSEEDNGDWGQSATWGGDWEEDSVDEDSEKFICTYIPADSSLPIREVLIVKNDTYLQHITSLLSIENYSYAWPKEYHKKQNGPAFVIDAVGHLNDKQLNERVSFVHGSHILGDAILVNVVLILQDPTTGKDVDSPYFEFIDTTCNDFEDITQRRKEFKRGGDIQLVRKYLLLDGRCDLEKEVPLTFLAGEWNLKTYPRALLQIICDVKRWNYSFSEEYSPPSGPFLCKVTLEEMQIEIIPYNASKKKKDSMHQAALCAVNYLIKSGLSNGGLFSPCDRNNCTCDSLSDSVLAHVFHLSSDELSGVEKEEKK